MNSPLAGPAVLYRDPALAPCGVRAVAQACLGALAWLSQGGPGPAFAQPGSAAAPGPVLPVLQGQLGPCPSEPSLSSCSNLCCCLTSVCLVTPSFWGGGGAQTSFLLAGTGSSGNPSGPCLAGAGVPSSPGPPEVGLSPVRLHLDSHL